jgi:hypothetical protein
MLTINVTQNIDFKVKNWENNKTQLISTTSIIVFLNKKTKIKFILKSHRTQ